jgi:hypothetical protein
MLKAGDRVRLSEATRKDFLAHGGSGEEHVEVARKNLVGEIVEQVGVRGRELVIGFLVDFGEASFVVSEDGLVLVDEEVEEENTET